MQYTIPNKNGLHYAYPNSFRLGITTLKKSLFFFSFPSNPCLEWWIPIYLTYWVSVKIASHSISKFIDSATRLYEKNKTKKEFNFLLVKELRNSVLSTCASTFAFFSQFLRHPPHWGYKKKILCFGLISFLCSV